MRARTSIWRLSAMALVCATCALGGCRGAFRGVFQGEASSRRARVAGAMERAEEALTEGRIEEALRLFQVAIEENPELTTAHLRVASVQRERGDYAAAETSYRQAAKLEPRNFDAQYGHALTLQLLNRLTEAVRAYLRALSIQPNDFDANFNLATAYLRLGEATQGLPYARRAVAAERDSGAARVNLAAIYSSMGRHDEAVLEYQAAAERMELTPDLMLNLATSLGRADRHREMLNTIERVIEIAPSAGAFERMGFAQFRLGEYDAALRSFEQAVRLDARHYPALNGVGVSLLNRYLTSEQRDMGARRRAVEALRRSLQINPGQPRIVDLLSRYG